MLTYIKKNGKDIILLLIIAFLVVPVFMGFYYARPMTDDFLYATEWENFDGSLIAFIAHTIYDMYTSWQGTYFSVSATHIPILSTFGFTGVKISLAAVTALFLFSLIFFSAQLTKLTAQENKKTWTLLIFTVLVFYTFYENLLTDNFYWFTGCMAYTLPLACLLFAVSFYIKQQLFPKKKYIAGGCILAFLAAGGPLNVAALLCALLLFGILYNFIVLKRKDRGILIGIFALAGALINSAAPGNFVRYGTFDYEGEGMNPVASVAVTAMRVVYSVFKDFRSGVLLTVALLMFLLGRRFLRNSLLKFEHPVLITLYGIFAVFITDFPFVAGYNYGYSSVPTYMMARGLFVEHLAIGICVIFISLYWGGWAAKKNLFNFTGASLFPVALIMLIMLSNNAYDIVMNTTPIKMAVHILNGDFAHNAETDRSIVEQITSSDAEDVTVYAAKDPDGFWVNVTRSHVYNGVITSDESFECAYYGKKSITLEYTD